MGESQGHDYLGQWDQDESLQARAHVPTIVLTERNILFATSVLSPMHVLNLT